MVICRWPLDGRVSIRLPEDELELEVDEDELELLDEALLLEELLLDELLEPGGSDCPPQPANTRANAIAVNARRLRGR